MKPLLKCQYCTQYPTWCNEGMLAARHFIFTVKYSRISPQVNILPDVTLSLCQYLNMHTHPYREREGEREGERKRETSWNCLISPSFNYLPWCPWDSAKGSVLMREGSIEKKDKESVLPHLCLPSFHHTTCFPLFASSYCWWSMGQTVCVCVCVHVYDCGCTSINRLYNSVCINTSCLDNTFTFEELFSMWGNMLMRRLILLHLQ